VAVKHLHFKRDLFAFVCLVSSNVVVATAPAIAQEDSMQKSPKMIVAETPKKSAPENSPIIIVTHVDAMPPFTVKATKLLCNYHENTLKDHGNKRIDILQQVGRPNHFTIVEEWENQKAFNEHEGAPHTRQFRSDMQEALGAPFDERPHHFIEP
jgi:quinol monooxygenase YgiN